MPPIEPDAVVLANGDFPTAALPLALLRQAKRVVCCDGAAIKLLAHGLEPHAIVGDMDSLPSELRHRLGGIVHQIDEQEFNDLSKAVHWCLAQGLRRLAILGATGLRDDHSLGNIMLLPRYARMGVDVRMLTDTGIFTPLLVPTTLSGHPGQQVSIFSPNPTTRITTQGLEYPLHQQPLPELWMGTLNCCPGSSFSLSFDAGPLVVFQTY